MSYELNYSDFVTIRIIRVFDDFGPSHWQMEIDDKDGSEIGGGTAPTFAGVVDMAYDMAKERNDIDDPEWSRFDANGSKNEDS